MASIPLPALDIRPPQPQEDPMQQYGRLLALRNEMQMQPYQLQAAQQQAQSGQLQLQQQQIALKNQQAMTAAYQKWDGKNYSDLAHLALQAGASGDAVMGLQQHALNLQKTYSDIAAQDATTGSKNLAALKDKNDIVAGQINAVMQMPDDQIAQGLVSTAQDLAQKGMIDPQHAQMAAQIAQSGDPAKIRSALGVFEKNYMAMSEQMDAAQKRYKAVPGGGLYDVSGPTPKPALAGTLSPENWNAAIDQAIPNTPENAPLRSRTQSMVNFYLSQGNIAEAQKAIDAASKQVGAIEQQTNPKALAAKEAVAEAEGTARAKAYGQFREYQVFDNKTGRTIYMTPDDINDAAKTEPGRYTAPSYTPGALGAKDATNYFVSGKGGQQLTAFGTAIGHLDTLSKLANDLGNGNIQVFNRAAQAWAEQTGNPAPANFAAAKNAMSGEVAAALKASGATDQEISKVGETFSRAQSPAQLQGAINTYRSLLTTKRDNLRKQYEAGMRGQPNFGQTQENASPSAGGDFFSQFGGKSR